MKQIQFTRETRLRHPTPFWPLVFEQAGLFWVGFYVESLIARFVNFWIPKTPHRTGLKVFATILRRVFYGMAMVFLLAAVLVGTGVLNQ